MSCKCGYSILFEAVASDVVFHAAGCEASCVLINKTGVVDQDQTIAELFDYVRQTDSYLLVCAELYFNFHLTRSNL